MGESQEFKEVYNVGYFFAALVTLLALPLMHIIIGWFAFYL